MASRVGRRSYNGEMDTNIHPTSAPPAVASAGFIPHSGKDGGIANAQWWSASAQEYLEEHGDFLGPSDFCWCPEGLRESDAELLGPIEELRSKKVLEVGAGAAQCSRYLTARGIDVIATDIALGMCEAGLALNAQTGIDVAIKQADARALPFPAAHFDVVFTSFGALPFVPDAHQVHREVARVLKPGGTWVFSVTHPIRWAFADDPTSVTAIRSYFDRTPYVELDTHGDVVYAEYHRTFADHITDLISAGFKITGLLEPQWPAQHDRTWGGWGPQRGKYLPGSAIFSAEKVT